MSPLVRSLLLAPLLVAAAWASTGAPPSEAVSPKAAKSRGNAKVSDSRKDDANTAAPAERPAAANDAPSANNTTAPAREAAKPAPPACKRRPAWPPPSELIS